MHRELASEDMWREYWRCSDLRLRSPRFAELRTVLTNTNNRSRRTACRHGLIETRYIRGNKSSSQFIVWGTVYRGKGPSSFEVNKAANTSDFKIVAALQMQSRFQPAIDIPAS